MLPAGVTDVGFHAVPAPFIPFSKTLILAVVPAGATTGYVAVTTAAGR